MSRITKKSCEGYIVSENDIDKAINKLGLFEDIAERVVLEQEQYSAKMNELKLAGKEKTVAFKELMIKKLNNVNLIATLEAYDLM